MHEVELRCPRFAWALLAKLTYSEARERAVEGDRIEISCSACKQHLRKRGGLIVGLVLHRYDLVGEFVETEHRA